MALWWFERLKTPKRHEPDPHTLLLASAGDLARRLEIFGSAENSEKRWIQEDKVFVSKIPVFRVVISQGNESEAVAKCRNGPANMCAPLRRCFSPHHSTLKIRVWPLISHLCATCFLLRFLIGQSSRNYLLLQQVMQLFVAADRC
jgi:hypothetical protein